MTQRRILSPEARVALWRSLQTFTLTRIVIALVLLLELPSTGLHRVEHD